MSAASSTSSTTRSPAVLFGAECLRSPIMTSMLCNLSSTTSAFSRDSEELQKQPSQLKEEPPACLLHHLVSCEPTWFRTIRFIFPSLLVDNMCHDSIV
mmetsp:Transcript_2766/g.9283  ORF Transcript_2766/g.9283 Transcript_2766/m.9283 type:complete len:98 (-) Transcript_2766:805-1098(-)